MFSPGFGSWSVEDFSDSSGFTGVGFTLTGGYLSLEPIETTGISFSNRWPVVTGWSMSNNLNSDSIISSQFTGIATVAIAGQTVYNSGYSTNLVTAGAWNIRTEMPLNISGFGFSGMEARLLELGRSSPNNSWHYHFLSGGTQATIEVDVASLYSPHTGDGIFGFATGQESLTGLSRVQGLVGHGIYIDNGSVWDFIEITPIGIRSINHPELALDIDLTQPKRIRLGVSNSNIYLSTEDGRGIAGISKYNTLVSSGNDAKICFGAPPLTGLHNKYPFKSNGLSGFVGETLWDNIKILLGKNVISETTGQQVYYTTNVRTEYIGPFDPGIPITNWNSAIIAHTQHNGGLTTVTTQYSGAGAWVNGPSIILTGQAGPASLDLDAIPIYSSSRTQSTHNKVQNPIRFQVQMQSSGFAPPPSLDSITVSAATEPAMLDMLPNWKPINQPVIVQIAINSGDFFNPHVVADQYTTFLLNTPTDTFGFLTGTNVFEESSIYSRPIGVIGTVEQIPGDPVNSTIRNIILSSGRAITGSSAASSLGTNPAGNYFANPLMDDGFNSITGDPAYRNNKSFGNLALGLKMVPSYTGKAAVIYQPQEVFRSESAAESTRLNSVVERSLAPSTHYVQTVIVPQNSFNGVHDSSVGFEAIIPSGIASGNTIISFDIQIPYGSGINIYATGSLSGNAYSWNLQGQNYRTFKNASFPIVGHTGAIYVGFVVPTGTPSSDYVQYSVDNLLAAPYSLGSMYCTGVTTFNYQSGLIRDSYSGILPLQPILGNTVASMSCRILAYPTGTNNIIFSKHAAGNDIFKLYITPQGYLGANVRTSNNSRASNFSSTSHLSEIISTGFVTDYQAPLGEWIDLGLTHQCKAYNKLAQTNYTGNNSLSNFASTNRLYVTINGSPVGVLDLQSQWITQASVALNPSPVTSILADTTGTIVIGSGIPLDVANIKLGRPVIADVEVDQSIKYSKVSLPYFVPDCYFKPSTDSGLPNLLSDYAAPSNFGKDFFLGSIYNFDGPGYTNWDHGPWGNHLLFYGSVYKSGINPYNSGLGCTFIPSGSYAIAKYSSATERQINNAYNLFGIADNSNFLDSYYSPFHVGGWVYPYMSGKEFFKLCQSDTDLDNNYISLGFTNDMRLTIKRKASYDVWTATGTTIHNLTGWNWIEAVVLMGLDFGPILSPFVPSPSLVMGYSTSGLDVYTGYNLNFASMSYQGKSGDAQKSCFIFGKDSSVGLCDWFISPVYSLVELSPTNITGNMLVTGSKAFSSKSGRYQALLSNNEFSNIQPIWQNYNKMTIELSATNEPSEQYFAMAMHNKYDNFSRMNGGVTLFPEGQFKSIPSYYLDYDTYVIDSVIGTNYSPIRIGNQVPDGAVNLARISSPPMSSESSLSIIDLSFKNTSNLSSFKDGVYTISKGKGTTGTNPTNSYRDVNSGIYLGRSNLVLSGQAHSKDIIVTSSIISDVNSNTVHEALYAYLLGRGQYAIKLDDSYPHPTGQLGFFDTGSHVNNYITNLGRLKDSIKLKDSQGEDIPFETFPFNVISSPLTPALIAEDISTQKSFNINGVGSYTGNTQLPDGIFSVILLTSKRGIGQDNSVWAHYSSYDVYSSDLNFSHREIVNPVPLTRQELSTGSQTPGRYSLTYNSDSLLYSVNMFGINSGYTTKL